MSHHSSSCTNAIHKTIGKAEFRQPFHDVIDVLRKLQRHWFSWMVPLDMIRTKQASVYPIPNKTTYDIKSHVNAIYTARRSSSSNVDDKNIRRLKTYIGINQQILQSRVLPLKIPRFAGAINRDASYLRYFLTSNPKPYSKKLLKTKKWWMWTDLEYSKRRRSKCR